MPNSLISPELEKRFEEIKLLRSKVRAAELASKIPHLLTPRLSAPATRPRRRQLSMDCEAKRDQP